MADFTGRSDSRLMLELMMHALRVRDERLNAIASELLTRFGALAVRDLVREAVIVKNRPDHRIRALAVLGRIRPSYGPDVMDLAVLLHERNADVKEAACKLLGNFGMVVGLPGA